MSANATTLTPMCQNCTRLPAVGHVEVEPGYVQLLCNRCLMAHAQEQGGMRPNLSDVREYAYVLRLVPRGEQVPAEMVPVLRSQMQAAWKVRADRPTQPPPVGPFQERVRPWLHECFGREVAENRVERNHRFIEEALELVQACGCTREHALQIVEYVYGRPPGEPHQETGGVMVTLAALCLAQGICMHTAAECELERVWQKIDVIRAKQARKARDSALPGSTPTK